MKDIQKEPAEVALAIDRVGVRHISLPLVVSDRAAGRQHTVANVSLDVDLPAHFKGTHMSRFIESLENWVEDLSYSSMKRLLHDIQTRLQAYKAQASFVFPFFMRKSAPATGATSTQGYTCTLTGSLEGQGKPKLILEVVVPVMTVCPCSKAISKEGAHSQRADVRIAVQMRAFHWLEEFIEIAESSASYATYPLLKREDEKVVTEGAFANPCFVEDVVRNVANKLDQHGGVTWYKVEVESYESIHAHNAFALIERTIEQVTD